MAALHLRDDPTVGKLLGELALDLRHHALAARCKRRQPLADDAESVRVELMERQVLELLAHLVHAHAAGERRIDVERLLGDAACRDSTGHEIERAHVVEAVGELDQQHAHIRRDREQELAQIFGLLGLAGDEVELLQLGQAVDQRTDFRTEFLVDFGFRCGGVFDGVVEQCRHDGRIVELKVGQDRGDFERVREIRIARGAGLRAVRLHRVHVSAVEQVLVGVRIVALDPLDQVVLPHHPRLAPLRRLGDGRRERRRRFFHALRGALVLGAGQIGLRAGHAIPWAAAPHAPQPATDSTMGYCRSGNAFA